MTKILVLASKSPRRKELLGQLGYQFDCFSADIDETPFIDENPKAYVARLAKQKAEAAYQHLVKEGVDATKLAVLGSDTTVTIDQHILGKPKDYAEAQFILNLLSGRCHQVHTAIAVQAFEQTQVRVVSSEVYFKPLSLKEIEAYWQSGEPQDKAGAYGIQGLGGQFVKRIAGSYSAIVGLPLYETTQLLADFQLFSRLQK